MTTLRTLLLLLPLCGCAHTTIYSPQTGRVVCKTAADAALLTFTCRPDGSIQFYSTNLNHSIPTRAQQDGMAKVSAAVLSGTAGVLTGLAFH